MACTYATIYYAHHEISTLLCKYERHLIYYKRFIDDGNGLWNDRDDPDAWNRFKADVDDFGSLRWEVEERSREVNFLDLTITINDRNRMKHVPFYTATTTRNGHSLWLRSTIEQPSGEIENNRMNWCLLFSIEHLIVICMR